jgi:hypothetical protein
MRSVRSSHRLSSLDISRPSSARVSARSLIGSPRCDFTLTRKVVLPARTRCVSRRIISWRMSASGAVANVAFPPCHTHFLMTRNTASLSHSRRSSSLRAAVCSANTTAPNSFRFELVPSSSLPTRVHLSAAAPWNLQHPAPILQSLHDPRLLLETRIPPFVLLQYPASRLAQGHSNTLNIHPSVAGCSMLFGA